MDRMNGGTQLLSIEPGVSGGGEGTRPATGDPGLDEGRETVGERLVDRARLAGVDQARLPFGDGVGELVSRDVERARQRQAAGSGVAIAEHHLRSVPEGVAVVRGVVDCARKARARVVVRVTSPETGEGIVEGASVVVGAVDVEIRGRRVALGASQRTGERRTVAGAVDPAALREAELRIYSGDRSARHVDVNPVASRVLAARTDDEDLQGTVARARLGDEEDRPGTREFQSRESGIRRLPVRSPRRGSVLQAAAG